VPEGGLFFHADVSADDAPRDVVVDARFLAGQPDQRDDGEAAVGFHVQDVLAVVVRVGFAVLGVQQCRIGEVAGEGFGDPCGDSGVVTARVHGGADGADETSGGGGEQTRHGSVLSKRLVT
jgi:hypothetical protein